MEDVIKFKLFQPSLEDLAGLFHKELKKSFTEVDVSIVDCPNLKKEPFTLAAEGLSGSPRLADIGIAKRPIPPSHFDKSYNFCTVAKQVELSEALIIGTGAGPSHILGLNCDLVTNIKVGKTINNCNYTVKLTENDNFLSEKLEYTTDFSSGGNMFICEGNPGKVLKVHVKHRTDTDNFVSTMRKILEAHYGNKPVGIGGAFLIKNGKANLHVVPNFSLSKFETGKDVRSVLKVFNMSAPLVCLSTFVSHDPGLDLEMEHTHCFSHHGEGGHYREDTTPDEVEYLGYFNIAEFLFRIDASASGRVTWKV